MFCYSMVFSIILNNQVAKWYPLLHCKYGKTKPELRLALYLDDDKTPQKDGIINVIQGKKKK